MQLVPEEIAHAQLLLLANAGILGTCQRSFSDTFSKSSETEHVTDPEAQDIVLCHQLAPHAKEMRVQNDVEHTFDLPLGMHNLESTTRFCTEIVTSATTSSSSPSSCSCSCS